MLEERTVTLYLGARLQKDKIAAVGRLGPSNPGRLLASASLLMRDSEIFFVLASELFSESDHFFFL